MEACYPDEDTQDSREGSAVHWGGAELLRGGMIALGQVADNGVVLNVEMIDGAEMWANYIKARGPVGSIETTLRLPVLHPDNWGTPDHWWWDAATRTLYVDDLKYGHRWVDVYLNDQLMNYAALILHSLGLFVGNDDIRIVFTLVLPRCYTGRGPIQRWPTTLGAIRPYLDDLRVAFHGADMPDVKCNASDVSACFDCKARHDCEANQQATSIAVQLTSQPIPLHLSPAAQARQLRVLRDAEDRIKSMREGMEQSLTQTIRRSHAVPHFTLQNRPGREVFTEDAPANGIIEVGALYGVNMVKRQELITPKQAIKAGVPAAVVRMYSRTNSGALELVEDDGSIAARIFNQDTE